MAARDNRRHQRTSFSSGWLILAAAGFLSGCSSSSLTPTAAPVTVPTIATRPQGAVHGGQQPVSGSTIQLWQVGTTGYGVGATPVGSATVTSALGNFSFASDFSCANTTNGNNSLIYITATGGNPGLAGTVSNSALRMMVALGSCGSISSSTYVSINEVTTIGTVYALAQFIGPTGLVGSYGNSPQGLTNAFANVNNLVNTATGAALSVTPNGNGIVPQAEIYTLADMLAPCINSAGPTSSDCSTLFSLTTPDGGSPPTTSLGAAVNIALNPGHNVPKLLVLPTPTAPFQPVVNSANDLTMAIGFATSGANPASLAVDTKGNLWIANHGSGGTSSSLSLISPLGVPASNSPFQSSATINGATAVAIDTANNAWITSHDNNSTAEFSATVAGTTTTITTTNGPFTAIGLSSPSTLAIDGTNDIWIVNSGNNSLTELFNNNYNGNTGSFANVALNAPGGIAFDNSGNLWAANTGGASIVKINAQATALIPATFSGGGITSPSAVAIDNASNVWVTDSTLSQIAEVSSAGTAVSSNAGYTGAGITGSTSDAIDGSGNVWIADLTGNRLSELSPVGTALTSATGYQGAALGSPASLAIDASGNLWVANSQPNLVSGVYISVSEFVGLAAPVVTPLAQAVHLGQLGQRPGTVQPPVTMTNGPYTGSQFFPLNFDAIQSYDPANVSAGSPALAFNWTFGDGSTGQGPTPTHTYATAGTFAVTVTSTNAAGLSSTATTSATIAANTAQPGAPTAVAGGPYTAAAGAAVTFNSSASTDPNGLALTCTWTFGDGGSSSVCNPTYSYSQGGNYSVVLTVANGTAQGTASTVASISTPPLAALVPNAGGPYTVAVNQPVTLSGTQTNSPAGRQLGFTWNFGDGKTGTGPSPIHIYTTAGSYTATMTVSDGASSSGTATAQVTVSGPAAEAISATAGGPYQDVTGHAIVFDASASNDNLGNSLTYAWNFGDGSTGTGATPTHAYATAGSYTASVTVSSANTSATASTSVPISAMLGVTITSPTANALFATTTTTVTGTTTSPNLAVTVNGVAAQVSGNTFTASGVSLREGVNLISASATDGNGGVGTGVVSVIMDATAPTASITSPANGATVTSPSVAVAGLVNDIVTGTIGSNNVTVTVNGQPAQVNNRSYLLPSLQLVPGPNVITVVATDNVGNTSQTVSNITFLPPTTQLSIVKLNGDGQTGTVKTVLPQSLQVQLVSASGTPVAGRPITFAVTRSDGNVEVMPTIAQTLTVTTDANGKASALFQLGSRSGLGINQVSATTPGAAGAAVFTETSTLGAAASIHIVNGQNQRGLLGQSLAQALQVIVQDAGGNPVPGVTVNYSSIGATDGTIDNAAPVTDANGKAIANLTIGMQEGYENYVVTADFAGDAGVPVNFTASAFAPGPMAATSVSGTVLDNANVPVKNATVTLTGTGLSTVTNASGNFTISGAPVGTVTLTVDGSTSTGTETLPFLSFVLQDLPGQNNTLGKPIYLPSIDINNAQTVGGSDPVTLTMTGVPGVAFTIAPNSVTFPDGSKVGKLSLSQVKSDMVPMQPTNGSGPDLIWTLQPAGTRFSVPVQVTLPNTQALPPGTVSEMYQYDHDLEQFVSAGTGHVSADGSVIVSDPGFGITKAGWGHGPILPDNNGCVTSCVSTNPCVSAKLSPSRCLCIKTALVGKVCGAGLPQDSSGNQQSCQFPGTCTAYGTCTGYKLPYGTPCSPKPDYCDIGAQCNGGGTCVSTGKVPDVTNNQENYAPDTITAETTLQSVFGPANAFLQKIGFTGIKAETKVTSDAVLTYKCCSQLQQMNVRVLTNSVTPSITVSCSEVPLYLPNGTPMGVSMGSGNVYGVYGQLNFQVSGTLGVKNDSCTQKTCITFGLQFAPQVQLGVHLPNLAINLNLYVTSGFSVSSSAGCGTLTFTVATLPIVAKGEIQLFGGQTLSAAYILVNSVNLIGPKTVNFPAF